MAKRQKRARAPREKRAIVRKRKSTTRRQARKAPTTRNRKTKRTIAKPRVKSKRARAKNAPPKIIQRVKPQRSPELETVVVDVIEEPIPGVITVTEFEETEIRQQGDDRD